MGFEFSSDQVCNNWAKAGSWFENFVELGNNLARFSKLESLKLDRILVSVPRKEFVSLAILYGYSLNKFKTKFFCGTEMNKKEIGNFPLGTRLRIYLASGYMNCKLMTFEQKGQKILLDTGNGKRRWNSIHSIKKIFELPNSHPLGDYTNMDDIGNNPYIDSDPEFWKSQSDPGFLVFSDRQYFEEQIQKKIRNQELSILSEKSESTIKDSIRIDHFLEHGTPSFINTYAGINEFTQCQNEEPERFARMPWIMLDGNNATNKIAAMDELLDKKILAIMELGAPRSQSKALQSFSTELNRFSMVDIRTCLVWNPPPGVQIWGWAQ